MTPIVHTYEFDVLESDLDTERLRHVISQDEQTRAAGIRRPIDRIAFVAGRALSRLTLARHLDATPQAIEFQRNPFGKPYLESGPSFNLSHSGSAVLLAITQSGQLGVDIEQVRSMNDMDDVARRIMSAAELDEYIALSGAERESAFFRIWCRKEAFVKAIGHGLSAGLERLVVSMDADPSNAFISADTRIAGAASWCIRTAASGPDYVAAIALDVEEFEVRNHDAALFLNHYDQVLHSA